ncbi:hypothetical protein MKW92_043989 [Papaver armeniacum]|nr:hypothetical protein MKW92_043989 [Papaver armeniacum]
MMSNKRSREEMEESIAATMAKCLMLLSRDRGDIDYQSTQFSSFQALGGHRASHKKSRLMELYSLDNQRITYNHQQAKKQKIHECSICGLKFAIGQALGGHMRRHRAEMIESSSTTARGTPTTGLSSDITRQKKEPLKRSNSSRRVRSGEKTEDSIEVIMAKCFMLLSRDKREIGYQSVIDQQQTRTSTSTQHRVYECKTCNKQFPSFQALGGHNRASHKTRRVVDLYSSDNPSVNYNQKQGSRVKIHRCSICGSKFAAGQALGGHMRRHRDDMVESSTTIAGTGLSSSLSSDITTAATHQKVVPQVSVLKRSNSRRVLSLDLDLSISLDPLDNNDFDFSTDVKASGKHISTPSTIYSII